MAHAGAHTLHETLSQPEAWASALDAVATQSGAIRDLIARFADHPLLIAGSGSPYYLAISIAMAMRQHARRTCLATPSAEIILHPRSVFHDDRPPLMIIFSRSGATSEAISAARTVRRRGGAILAVGCDASSTLLKEAELAVEVVGGREQSPVQTRSWTGMYVAGQAIVAIAAGESGADGAAPIMAALEQLPAFGPAYVERARSVAHLAAGGSIERIFVLGSGTRYGLACEAALKFQEMSLTDAQPFHTLEFRHGPMSMADERALVVGLVGDEGAEEEVAVLQEAQQLGARVLALTDRPLPVVDGLDNVLAFEAGLPEFARGVLYLPPLQFIAYERSIAKKLDPDSPRNVTAFIHRASLERAAE